MDRGSKMFDIKIVPPVYSKPFPLSGLSVDPVPLTSLVTVVKSSLLSSFPVVKEDLFKL